MLSKEAIEEFKRAYKEEYNEEISDEKALDLGINLLTMFRAIYRPVKKEWLAELEKKDEADT